MRIIVISPTKTTDNEISVVCQLFKSGLQTLHLRKPGYSAKKLKEYLQSIPKEYHNRIVIHSHHKLALKFNLQGIHYTSKDRKFNWKRRWLKYKIMRKNPYHTVSTSFHKIMSLDQDQGSWDYVFLSPIFDSISNKDYQSGFNEFNLKKALDRTLLNVIALGGIDTERIPQILEYNFFGCALLGTIWESENPVQSFIEFKNQLESQ